MFTLRAVDLKLQPYMNKVIIKVKLYLKGSAKPDKACSATLMKES